MRYVCIFRHICTHMHTHRKHTQGLLTCLIHNIKEIWEQSRYQSIEEWINKLDIFIQPKY